MKFYMAAGRLVGTQAEAKERDRNFTQHDVPTDKDGLMAYVNDLLDKIDGSAPVAAPVVTPEVEPDPAPELAPPPGRPQQDEAEMKRRLALSLRGMETDAVEEKILESNGAAFGRFLSSAICRLGELGRAGFDAFNATRAVTGDPEAAVGTAKSRARIAGSDERGLRYLALLLVKDLMQKDRADG